MKIKLQRVKYIPKELEPGILYLAEEFGAVAHLCPCGCGSKISTPVGAGDWKLKENRSGPTLSPSIGNSYLRCKSHYWIRNGEIEWALDEECEEAVAVLGSKLAGESPNQLSAPPGIWKKMWRWLTRR